MKHDIIVSKMISYALIIQKYCSGLEHDSFLANTMVVDACVFNLSQIGELAGRMDKIFQANHPEVKWNQIIGLRNRIVHDYEGVNRELIWEIITDDVPNLICALRKIKSEMGSTE